MPYYLRVGDVISVNACEYVIDLVNECRARGQPLTKETVTIRSRFKGNKTVSRLAGSRNSSFAPTVPSRDDVVRWVDVAKQFPAPQRATEPEQVEAQEQNTLEDMSKKQTPEIKINKVGKGRASMIHTLREQGVKKPDAFEQAKKKFPELGQSLFDKIWAREAKSVAVKTAPAPAKKSAPPVKKSSPPPPKRAAEQIAEKQAAAPVAS